MGHGGDLAPAWSRDEWQWPLLALTEAVRKKQPKSQTVAAPPQLTAPPHTQSSPALWCGSITGCGSLRLEAIILCKKQRGLAREAAPEWRGEIVVGAAQAEC